MITGEKGSFYELRQKVTITKRNHKATENHCKINMAQRPFRQEAGKQNAKTTKVIKGPKAIASEIKSRTPTETQSQSPLAQTSPPLLPPALYLLPLPGLLPL